MSADSIHQISQAIGAQPVSDWHPPSMTLLVHFLVSVTGKLGSYFIVHVGILLIGVYLLSLYALKATGKIRLSLGILAIPFLPFVINISMVVWKDTLLAFTLLLGAALLIYATVIKDHRIRYILIATGFALMIVCSTFRYNAMFAVLPLVFIIPTILELKRRFIYGIIACVLGLTLSFTASGLFASQSLKEHPETAVMLDDITAIGRDDLIRNTIYENVRKTCDSTTPEIMNAYVLCTSESDRLFLKDNSARVRSDWIHAIVSNPIDYIRYRLSVFSIFMFPESNRLFIFQYGVDDNQIGIKGADKYVVYGLAAYVNGFAKSNFAFLFQPWFWATILILAAIMLRKYPRSMARTIFMAVAVSGILYLASYVPFAVATDFRYSYWSVFACIISVIGLLVLYVSESLKRNIK